MLDDSSTWTKVAGKFDEIPKSTKKIFFQCLADEGWGGLKCAPEPKL